MTFLFYRIQILYFLRKYWIPQILAQTLPQKALGSWNGWYKLSPPNKGLWLGSPNYVTKSPYNSYKGPWFFCSTPESSKFRSSNRIWSDSGWWFQTFFIVHNIWDVILPIDELIFFKMGRSTTNQIWSDFFWSPPFCCWHLGLVAHLDRWRARNPKRPHSRSFRRGRCGAADGSQSGASGNLT